MLVILIQQIIRFLRQLPVTKYLFNDYSYANLSNNNYRQIKTTGIELCINYFFSQQFYEKSF